MATEGIKFEPPAQSRDEDILYTTLQGQLYEKEAESRIEDLLIQLNESIVSGGGGVSNQTALMPIYDNVTLEFTATTGYYDHTSYNYVEFSGQSACELSVNEGEKYTISGKNFYQALRVVFFDSSDTVIGGVWTAANRLFYAGTAFTIPENCVKISVHRGNSADLITLKKATSNMQPKTSLYGKKICCIGDSLTERNGKATTNWVQDLCDWNGCEIQNLGIGGTGFARGGDNRYIYRIPSIMSNADIIGVAVSFNDMAEDLPVGTATDTGTSSLCGYANDFFSALLNAKTSVPIICYVQSAWGEYHPDVQRSGDFVDAIKTICKAYGVPFYDHLYFGGTLKPWRSANKTTYYTPDDTSAIDGVHPNSLGHKTIAKALQPHFIDNTI